MCVSMYICTPVETRSDSEGLLQELSTLFSETGLSLRPVVDQSGEEGFPVRPKDSSISVSGNWDCKCVLSCPDLNSGPHTCKEVISPSPYKDIFTVTIVLS